MEFTTHLGTKSLPAHNYSRSQIDPVPVDPQRWFASTSCIPIYSPSPRRNVSRYLGHDKVNGQISEKNIEPVAFEIIQGALQFPSKYSAPDLKRRAKDSFVLAKKAANPFFLLSRTLYDSNYFQHISCLSIMYTFIYDRYISFQGNKNNFTFKNRYVFYERDKNNFMIDK